MALTPDQVIRNEKMGLQMQKEEEVLEDRGQLHSDQSPGNKKGPPPRISEVLAEVYEF